MLDQVISALAARIVAVISATGYFGIVVLMAIESACIPLPSEIIMPFSGYLVSVGRFSLIGAATAGALGFGVATIGLMKMCRVMATMGLSSSFVNQFAQDSAVISGGANPG